MSDRELLLHALEDIETLFGLAINEVDGWARSATAEEIVTRLSALSALRARLAEPDDEPAGRLVADMYSGHEFIPRIPGDWSALGKDLYTRPAARKVQPLTDAECDRIIDAERWDTLAGRRAIVRRAHGITGDSHE